MVGQRQCSKHYSRLSLSFSLSHTHTHTDTLWHTHTHTHTLIHTHNTHTHTHTQHTHIHTQHTYTITPHHACTHEYKCDSSTSVWGFVIEGSTWSRGLRLKWPSKGWRLECSQVNVNIAHLWHRGSINTKHELSPMDTAPVCLPFVNLETWEWGHSCTRRWQKRMLVLEVNVSQEPKVNISLKQVSISQVTTGRSQYISG